MNPHIERVLIQEELNPETGSIKAEAASRGLKGETGIGVIRDYRNADVLIALLGKDRERWAS